MKKFAYIALALIVFCSCQPEHPADYLSFSGKLENATDSLMYINGYGFRKKIRINEDGSFKDSMKVDKASLYNLFTDTPGKRAVIYLKNGYDLQLTGNANEFFTSFQYKGKSEGAQSNNFVTQRFNFGQTAGNTEGFIALEKDAFLKKVERFRNGMDSIGNMYPKADPEMVKNSNEQNAAFFDRMEKNYDQMHQYYVQQQRAMERLAKGKPAPEFNDYEDYKGGKKSLKDFRGKYVYIDIWATWCKPCIAQFPSLKKLEEDFKGKNIEFVSISTDEQRRSGGSWEKAHSKWKNMVKKYSLGGTQLWAGEDQNRFSTEYMANTIPRFILIDPDGNIVNHDEMRPADPRITEYFNSLGIK